MNESRTIYFIPRYIGALKYYEKLFPALRLRGFEPRFLLFEDKGMIAYCKERTLACEVRFVRSGTHIPFFTPLMWEARLRSQFDGFLDEQPHALVTEPSVDQRTRALFKSAKVRGVKRYALQWALHTDPRKPIHRSLYSRYLVLRNRYGSFARLPFVGAYYLLLRVVFLIADILRGGDTFIHPHHYAEKLGVIDGMLSDYFLWSGWQSDQIQIVGFADYSLIRDEVRSVEEDASKRAALLTRYGLEEKRARILILSHPFYTGRNSVYLDEDEQRAYYNAVFDDVRSVYPESEATIIFKLHPREEKTVYTQFTKQGIRVYGNEADLNELIALSNLYIAHPLTAANFIIRASSKPAIFINFSPLSYLDEGKELYHLRGIVKSRDDFRTMLSEARKNTLPLQYDAGGIDPDSLSKIVDFLTQ